MLCFPHTTLSPALLLLTPCCNGFCCCKRRGFCCCCCCYCPLTRVPHAVFPPYQGDTSVACRLTDGGNSMADGEQFPYGRFKSPICACDYAPYVLVFGEDATYDRV